jgi:hypothetical protein
MPTFEAAEQAKDDPLRLPIPGADGLVRTYEIPVLDAAGLIELSQLERSVRMITAGLGDRVPDAEVAKLDAMTQRQHVELVLSAGTVDLMLKDRIDQRMFTAAAITAQTWHTRGTKAAYDAWERLAVHPGVDDPLAFPPVNRGAKNGGGNTSQRTGNSSSSRSRKSRRKGKTRVGR